MTEHTKELLNDIDTLIDDNKDYTLGKLLVRCKDKIKSLVDLDDILVKINEDYGRRSERIDQIKSEHIAMKMLTSLETEQLRDEKVIENARALINKYQE